MKKLFFLTKNKGKLEDARRTLAGFGIEVEQLEGDRVEIQGDDVREIALYSVRHADTSNLPVVVEDAGLFIEALRGFPGPYSSYVYRTIGCRGILKLMEGVRDRRARFRSAVAYFDGRAVEVFLGEVAGSIAYEERGHEGFGFDPIFIPAGYDRTFAEMGLEKKVLITHRARAFEALGRWLSGRKVNNMVGRG